MLNLLDPDFASADHTASSDQGLPPRSTSLGLPGSGGTLLGELYGSATSAFGRAAGFDDIALGFLEGLCPAFDVLLGLVQSLLDFFLLVANVFQTRRGPLLRLICTPFPGNRHLFLPAGWAPLILSLIGLSWHSFLDFLWSFLSGDFLWLRHLFPESLCVSFSLSVAFGLRSDISEGLGLSLSISLIIVLVQDLCICADLSFRLSVQVNF